MLIPELNNLGWVIERRWESLKRKVFVLQFEMYFFFLLFWHLNVFSAALWRQRERKEEKTNLRMSSQTQEKNNLLRCVLWNRVLECFMGINCIYIFLVSFFSLSLIIVIKISFCLHMFPHLSSWQHQFLVYYLLWAFFPRALNILLNVWKWSIFVLWNPIFPPPEGSKPLCDL